MKTHGALKLALVLTVIALLFGCGGGTRGTGATINGRLSFSNGARSIDMSAVGGVEVTATVFRGNEPIDSGQSTTDSVGVFEIVVGELGESIQFEFRSNTFEAEVFLREVVEEAIAASVDFGLSSAGAVTVQEVSFTEPSPGARSRAARAWPT